MPTFASDRTQVSHFIKTRSDFLMADTESVDSLGMALNWQQAEDVSSFTRCNLAFVIEAGAAGPTGHSQHHRQTSHLDLTGK